MIRKATRNDVPDLVKLGRSFVLAIGEEPHDASLANYMRGLIDHGVVFRSDKGMIGGIIVSPPWNKRRLLAQEMFWWAEDGQGLALMRAFEAWAEEQGIARRDVVFSAIGPEGRADKIIKRRGYAQVERSYRRVG